MNSIRYCISLLDRKNQETKHGKLHSSFTPRQDRIIYLDKCACLNQLLDFPVQSGTVHCSSLGSNELLDCCPRGSTTLLQKTQSKYMLQISFWKLSICVMPCLFYSSSRNCPLSKYLRIQKHFSIYVKLIWQKYQAFCYLILEANTCRIWQLYSKH